MITKDLIDYIKQAQKLGADRDGIERLLIENDWDYEDITEAFIALENEKHSVPIKFKEENSQVTAENALTINSSPVISPNLVYQNKPDNNYQEPISEKKPEVSIKSPSNLINPFTQSSVQPKTDFNNPKITGIPSEFKISSEKTNTENPFFENHSMPEKKSGVKILLLFFVILLIIGGTGFYSYTKGYLKIPFLDKKESTEEIIVDTNPDQQFVYSDLQKISQIISFGIPNSIVNEEISFKFSDDNNPLAIFIRNSLKNNGYSEEDYTSLDQYILEIKGAKDYNNNLAEGNLQLKNGPLSLDFSFRKNNDQIFLSSLNIPKEIFTQGAELNNIDYVISKSEIMDILSFLSIDALSENIASLNSIDLSTFKETIATFSRPELVSVSSSLESTGQYRTVVFDNVGGATIFGEKNINRATIVYDLNAIETGDFPLKSIEVLRNVIENSLTVEARQTFEKTDETILITEPVLEEINPFELSTIVKLKKEQIKKNDLLDNLSLVKNSALEYKKEYGGFSAFCNMESVLKAITLIGDESGFLVQCSDAKDGFVVYGQISAESVLCVDEKTQGEFNMTPSGLFCSNK